MNSNKGDRRRTSDSSSTVLRADRTQNRASDAPVYERRKFLSMAGGVAAAGLIAGCTSGNSGSEENTGANDGSDGNGGNAGSNNSSGPSSVDEWLADTGNYDSIEDMTGKSSVTVEVGAEGNNGANAFAPAAIKISPGTTVTWKWINGYHNVVDKNSQFSSGEPEQGATYEHTFKTLGTVLYYCEPHRSMGMKGAVIAEKRSNSESIGNTTDRTENA